ncbi:hypothetical protein MJM99_30925, partial [Salmonella enterica subsp. enterica serovar Kentucky]|nr:hypothetical protein [Salmonella enterica subsp. enterica serovar Kentucky]
MKNLKKRERAKTNASLISMVQRFSDITIMFGGLWMMPRNPAIFAKQTGFILYISHPAGILAPSFKSTRIQHEIICK